MDMDELVGRVDGLGRAMLVLAAHLEQAGLIDGPRLASDWRALRAPGGTSATAAQASLQVLADLAGQLSDARILRRSPAPR